MSGIDFSEQQVRLTGTHESRNVYSLRLREALAVDLDSLDFVHRRGSKIALPAMRA